MSTISPRLRLLAFALLVLALCATSAAVGWLAHPAGPVSHAGSGDHRVEATQSPTGAQDAATGRVVPVTEQAGELVSQDGYAVGPEAYEQAVRPDRTDDRLADRSGSATAATGHGSHSEDRSTRPIGSAGIGGDPATGAGNQPSAPVDDEQGDEGHLIGAPIDDSWETTWPDDDYTNRPWGPQDEARDRLVNAVWWCLGAIYDTWQEDLTTPDCDLTAAFPLLGTGSTVEIGGGFDTFIEPVSTLSTDDTEMWTWDFGFVPITHTPAGGQTVTRMVHVVADSTTDPYGDWSFVVRYLPE